VPTTFLVADVDGRIVGRAVIERCGGRFDSLSTAEDGHAVRRYWID
jgi:predicted acetyltransferase